MKKQLLFLVFGVLSMILTAQPPQSFKYQTVVRDNSGSVLSGQSVSFRLSILQGSSSGTVVYSEIITKTTNQFGLVTLNIGEGTAISGNFSSINWSTGNYWLKIEMDPTGAANYQLMGTSKFLSVPYAMHASTADNVDDADADPTNELQTLSQSGTTVTLSNGGGTIDISDNDNDPSNEFQTLSQNGTVVTLSNGGGSIDVSDNDSDPSNEIQTLSHSQDSLAISSGNKIYMPILWSKNGSKIYNSGFGNVGISNNDPQYSLDVNGDINIGSAGQLRYNGKKVLTADIDNVFVGVNAGKSVTTGSDNTFIGESAGQAVVAAVDNTFTGSSAGKATTTGNFNTFTGKSAGEVNTTGAYNVFTGAYSGKANTTGNSNIFIGANTGYQNSTGSENIFIGKEAGLLNVSGSGNVFLGTSAGSSETGSNKLYIENSSSSSPLIYGDFNKDSLAVNGSLTVKQTLIDASGDIGQPGQVLSATGFGTDWITISTGDNLGNHTATENIKLNNHWLSNDGDNEGVCVMNNGDVGIGTSTASEKLDVNGKIAINGRQVIYYAGAEDSDFDGTLIIGRSGGTFLTHNSGNEAKYNTFVGDLSGMNTTTGNQNTFVGSLSGNRNSTGKFNTFIGDEAGRFNETGSSNTFVGQNAGISNKTGGNNSYFGDAAGYHNKSDNNTFLGAKAGLNNNGSGNIFIGYQAGQDETGSDKLYIENTYSSSPLIYGDFSSDSLAVNGSFSIKEELIDASGDKGTAGQVLSSTGSGTDWIDVPDDNDWAYSSGNGLTGNAYHTGNISIGMTNSSNKLDVNGNVNVTKGNAYKIDDDVVLYSIEDTINNVFAGSYAGNLTMTGKNNSFFGVYSGHSITTGSRNTFIGSKAGVFGTTSESNTFVGNTAGFNSTGNNNTFIGDEAGYNNKGNGNTFLGENAGVCSPNATGSFNTYIGQNSGSNTKSGSRNTFIGKGTGVNNLDGSGNVFIGYDAGAFETGSNKLYIDNSDTLFPLISGDFSADSLCINGSLSVIKKLFDSSGDHGTSGQILSSTGSGTNWIDASSIQDNDWTVSGNNMSSVPTGNVGIGVTNPAQKLDVNGKIAINSKQALYYAHAENIGFDGTLIVGNGGTFLTHNSGNEAYYNTFLGHLSGYNVDSGWGNTFVGYHSGGTTQSGESNTFIGSDAGYSNNSGNYNTFVGSSAGVQNSSGNNNTFIGKNAGYNGKGNNNTFLGMGAGYNCENGSDNVFIGYDAGYFETGSNKLYIENSTSNTPLIYGEFDNDILKINGKVGINTNPSVQFEVMGSPNYAYMGGNSFAVYGNLNSTNKGDYAIYGNGTDDSGEDGDGYGYSSTLGGIKGYNYYGNPYTFATAGYSYLDYNRSGGAIGSKYDGTVWGSLGYKNSGGTTYGGYFTSSVTGSGKDSGAKVNNGIGVYGELFGADIHGDVYGAYIEGDNYALYTKGDVYKDGLDVHIQENDKGENEVLYTNVSTDVTIMTSGTAIISNGVATISFDESFSSLVSDTEPVVVTVTPVGTSTAVYITNTDKNGFGVKEINDGKNTFTVSYIAIGKRKGYEKPVLAKEVISKDYTSKVKQGLHNDNDTAGNGQGLYYENGKLNLGKHSSTLPPASKPALKEVK